MRVHPSNYRVVGFASTLASVELAALAHEAGLPLYEDGGSGQLADLRKYGVVDEPVVREIIESGVDVVSFSGDKLLGSAQAGLIGNNRSFRDCASIHSIARCAATS